MNWLWVGGEGPKDLPQWAYMHLVTVLKVNPDSLMDLQCVQQIDYRKDTLVNLIRIFDPKAVGETIKIKDFASLDEHTQLILYEGYMERVSGRVHLAPGMATQKNC